MSLLTKIFICPYFGDFPEWMGEYIKEAEGLKQYGYDFLLDTDLEGFKKRVKSILGLDCPIIRGTGKVWDYRPALGLLYAQEVKGYDFWGHTDFDCVYGKVDEWVTDDFLRKLDLHSNHETYVNGCWSLYRNNDRVNNLFKDYPFWQEKMRYSDPNGWVEEEYSRTLEKSGLKYKYTFWQGNPYTTTPNLIKENGRLYQDGKEIMMFHFRRSKRWPL